MFPLHRRFRCGWAGSGDGGFVPTAGVGSDSGECSGLGGGASGGEVDAAAVGDQRPGAPPLSMSDTLAQIGGSKSKTVSMSSRSVSAIGSPPPTYPYSGRARGFPSMSVQVYWQHRDQTSGVLRRWLSGGTSDLNISPARLAAIEGRLNAIPGELHDWHSAHSVYTALCRNHRWSLASTVGCR